MSGGGGNEEASEDTDDSKSERGGRTRLFLDLKPLPRMSLTGLQP